MATAIVITDAFDSTKSKEKFSNYLKYLGITRILSFSSLDSLKKEFALLEQEDLHIFFPSIYVRYKELIEITNLANNFCCISIGDFKKNPSNVQVICFYPKYFKVAKDSLFPIDVENTRLFNCNSNHIYYEKPANTPIISIYSHDRDIYLKLTLLGLMDSLQHCLEIPVYLILNQPTQKVLDIALEFQKKYDNIQILYLKENSGFAASNVAFQWSGIDKIIIGEDDFILSDAVKHLYPLWPYQFIDRLENVDFIGWTFLIENCGYWLPNWADLQTETRLGWHSQKILNDKTVPLAAQLFAVKKDFYKKCYNPNFKALQDTAAYINSNRISVPFLKGYHLGFSKNRDGFHNEDKYQSVCHNKLNNVEVLNMKTLEKRIINLNKMLEHSS